VAAGVSPAVEPGFQPGPAAAPPTKSDCAAAQNGYSDAITRTMKTVWTVLLMLATVPAVAAAESLPKSFYELKARTLAGKDQPLAAFKGKVSLVVNVASECGYTPQYAGLQGLYGRLKDRGLVVIGFPSIDFGGQEPGTPRQIAEFCRGNYGVTFPLMEKVRVAGPQPHAVYRFLGTKDGGPKWNFHKYLVARDGAVIAAFPADVEPDDPKLLEAVDRALGK
jgi:glutathione peroxidase